MAIFRVYLAVYCDTSYAGTRGPATRGECIARLHGGVGELRGGETERAVGGRQAERGETVGHRTLACNRRRQQFAGGGGGRHAVSAETDRVPDAVRAAADLRHLVPRVAHQAAPCVVDSHVAQV